MSTRQKAEHEFYARAPPNGHTSTMRQTVLRAHLMYPEHHPQSKIKEFCACWYISGHEIASVLCTPVYSEQNSESNDTECGARWYITGHAIACVLCTRVYAEHRSQRNITKG